MGEGRNKAIEGGSGSVTKKTLNKKLIPPPEREPIARRFGNLIRRGKLKDAMRLLKDDEQKPFNCNDMLNGKTITEILQEKHPDKREPHPSALTDTNSTNTNFHPVVFESIDAALIRSSALKANGSAGP
jgi:hypothetical protein